MRPLVCSLVGLLALAAPLSAQDDDEAGRAPIPTRYFASFIGSWAIPDSLLPADSPIRGRRFSLVWGPGERAVLLHEGHLPGDYGTAVLSGIAAWNPVVQRIEFLANNHQSDYLFKGEYTELSEDRVGRTYDVYYPLDHEFAKNGNPVIRFRESFTLLGEDSLRVRVEYWNKRELKWDPWSENTLHRVGA